MSVLNIVVPWFAIGLTVGGLVGFAVSCYFLAWLRRLETAELEEQEAHERAAQVLSKAFPDEKDVAFGQWLDWYEPRNWATPELALGSFIRVRLRGAPRPDSGGTTSLDVPEGSSFRALPGTRPAELAS